MLALEASGRWFESSIPDQIIAHLAQLVEALVLETNQCKFESYSGYQFRCVLIFSPLVYQYLVAPKVSERAHITFLYLVALK